MWSQDNHLISPLLPRRRFLHAGWVAILASVVITSLFWPANAYAVSSVEDIRHDVREFQQFFKSRFADVSLDSYQQGVSALPQYAPLRLNQELLMAIPPWESELTQGKAAWQAPLPSGMSTADCFAGKPPPTAYPYFFNDQINTIESDINACRKANGAPELDSMGGEMARLVAAFKNPWSGQPMDIDYRQQEVRELYDIGRQYFWAKRGQMNLSCANCHVHNAGNQLRGEVLSAALGHGTGFPVYSYSWALQGNPMGTLHRRYARCNALAGAAPLAAQSATYQALELYQAIMNTNVNVGAPTLRQ